MPWDVPVHEEVGVDSFHSSMYNVDSTATQCYTGLALASLGGFGLGHGFSVLSKALSILQWRALKLLHSFQKDIKLTHARTVPFDLMC